MAQQVAAIAAQESSSSQASKASSISGYIVLACILFFTVLGIWGLAPPRAVPSSAAPTEFSSGRAMNHVRAIAEKPRPIGSAEHEMARSYIINELKAQGLNPEVQTSSVELYSEFTQVATVHNVIARLKGEDNTKAVLLSAHYDSVPISSGASDNAAGVATLLEALKALKAGPPLKNDVIFLFTDGRELSEVGARAYLNHPWAKDTGIVLNFEARGTGGPVFLFETTRSHGSWLTEQFAEAVEYPIASSNIFLIYNMALSGTTNMTVFKDAFEGYNFANVEGRAAFHTRVDNVQSLDERSLQHNGLYAMNLVRKFGNMNLNDIQRHGSGNAIFFDLLGLTLIHYPLWMAQLFAVLVVVLFAAVLAIGISRKHLTVRHTALGFIALLTSTICAGLITYLAKEVIRAMSPAIDADDGNAVMLLGFVALAIAIVGIVYSWFAKRASMLNLAMGGLFCWLILMVVTSFFLPPASQVFTWPLVISLVPLGLIFVSNRERLGSTPFLVLLIACAIPGIFLIIPTIYTLHMTIGLSLPEGAVMLVALLIGLLIPQLSLLTAAMSKRWAFISAAAVLAITLLGAGALTGGYSADNPRPDSLFYGFNVDKGEAVWASSDEHPDHWVSQYIASDAPDARLYEFFPLGSGTFLYSPAPVTSLPAPTVTPISDVEANGIRRLHVRINSQRNAPLIEVATEKESPIMLAEINGKRTTLNDNRLYLRYFSPPKEGIELTLAVKSSDPLNVRIADYTYGITQSTGIAVKERPDDVTPSRRQMWKQDSAVVSKVYNF